MNEIIELAGDHCLNILCYGRVSYPYCFDTRRKPKRILPLSSPVVPWGSILIPDGFCYSFSLGDVTTCKVELRLLQRWTENVVYRVTLSTGFVSPWQGSIKHALETQKDILQLVWTKHIYKDDLIQAKLRGWFNCHFNDETVDFKLRLTTFKWLCNRLGEIPSSPLPEEEFVLDDDYQEEAEEWIPIMEEDFF